MRLVFATRNAHKLTEVREILAETEVEILTLDDIGFVGDPPETGDTFHDNALQKAHFVHAHTGLPCVADDSGLEVDALDGAPGVHSKRFSLESTAESNNALLLSELGDRTDRAARFRCVIALVGAGPDRCAEGRCAGQITTALTGSEGFGYDPLFAPDETPGKTMAQLTMAQKNAISHRGRAFRALPGLLAQR